MRRNETGQDTISVQEAARLLGVSRPTVYRLITEQRLPAAEHPVTGRKQLSRQEVLRFASVPYAASAQPAERVADSSNAVLAYVPVAEQGQGVVNSIFRLPELALELPVDDLSERVDHYRFHGLAEA